MKITDLELEGVKILEPRYFEDYRGYYSETYSKRTLAELGIVDEFVQDNHIFSKEKGTLRGIHFQNNPKSQIKLCRCIRGSVLDYIIDLRKGSPDYKKWICIELSAKNRKQILIPHGFGHAILTLENNCEFIYKVTTLYESTLDRSICYKDPEIAIDWSEENPIISQKDIDAPILKDSDINFIYKE